MSTNITLENLVSRAESDVNFRAKQLLKAKIRADFTGEDFDNKEVVRINRELQIAQNYLDVLTGKNSGEDLKNNLQLLAMSV